MVIYVKERRLRKEMYQAHKFIAKNIKLLRSISGLTQEQISELLHMSRSCYCSMEAGKKVPDFESIYVLSRFYNISLDYLLSFDIAEQMLSLLRMDRKETEALHFIECYLKLSHGAKEQIRARVEELIEKEKQYNKFPWDYGDLNEKGTNGDD